MSSRTRMWAGVCGGLDSGVWRRHFVVQSSLGCRSRVPCLVVKEEGVQADLPCNYLDHEGAEYFEVQYSTEYFVDVHLVIKALI